MGARYPNLVGRYKPCVPVVVVLVPGPRLGSFMFGHDGGVGCHGLTSGPPMA